MKRSFFSLLVKKTRNLRKKGHFIVTLPLHIADNVVSQTLAFRSTPLEPDAAGSVHSTCQVIFCPHFFLPYSHPYPNPCLWSSLFRAQGTQSKIFIQIFTNKNSGQCCFFFFYLLWPSTACRLMRWTLPALCVCDEAGKRSIGDTV